MLLSYRYRFFADRSKEKSTIAANIHLPTLEVQGLPEDISKYFYILVYCDSFKLN